MRLSARSGFSLLQLSIILMIGGLMVAGSLPGGEAGGEAAKLRITIDRMERIEMAMQQFMTKNQRRPYPSYTTAPFSSYSFGLETTIPNDYSVIPTDYFTSASLSLNTISTTADDAKISKAAGFGSTITRTWLVSAAGIIRDNTWVERIEPEIVAPDTAPTMTLNKTTLVTSPANATLYFRNPLVAGGVPTKALGLPDEYAMDGFGRRIIYMVDSRATDETSCLTLQGNGDQGALALSSSETFETGTYDHVMWALLSHGKDGQGATSIQGSATANRIKTGNTDASTLVNAFYDGSQATSFTNLGLVNKPHTSSFDDIVWVKDATKNTCALGSGVNSSRDFRIDGGGGANALASAAFGDINGDGYDDMVLGIAQQNVVRVIFGKKNNWPEPDNALLTATSSDLNGVNGFSIASGSVSGGFGATVATGDVNGDGYDDIIGCSTAGGTGCAVVFGGANWPAAYTIGTTTTPNTARTISGLQANAPSIAVGDVNGDGYADIALPYDAASGSWAVGLIYGKSKSVWTSDGNLTLTTDMNGTKGVYFNVPTVVFPVSPNASTGTVSYGRTGASDLAKRLVAICDVDGDGFRDIVIPGVTIDATVSPQRMYVVLGQSSVWSNSSGHVNIGTLAEAKQLTFPNIAEGSTPLYDIKALGCKDINSDGMDDLLFYLRPN